MAEPNELAREDLVVGRWYRGKRPRKLNQPFSPDNGEYNDRYVLYIGRMFIQYDGPVVRTGQKYPCVTVEKFLKWVGKDVTAEYEGSQGG